MWAGKCVALPACLCTYLNQSTRFQKMVDDAWLDVRNW